MTQPIPPDPKTVGPEAMSLVAQAKAGVLFNDVLLRDAKIHELQQYAEALQVELQACRERNAELEQQARDSAVRAPGHAKATAAAGAAAGGTAAK